MAPSDIVSFQVARRANDARKKSHILMVYSVDVVLKDEAVGGVGRRAHLRVALQTRQHGRFVLQDDVDRIDHQDVRLLARVVGPPGDLERDDVGRRHGQPRRQGLRQGLGRMAEGKLQFGYTQHGRVLAAAWAER